MDSIANAPCSLYKRGMKFVATVLLLMVLCAGTASAAALKPLPLPPDGKAEAVKAAQAWVVMLDQGDYDGSWKSSAEQLRKAVSRKKWKSTMSPVRDPLGALSGPRQEKSVQLTREIPGAPDAQYAIVELGADFAKKPGATETVTLVWEKDGRWRVSSYAIR